MVRRAIDAETHPADHDLETDPGPLEPRLDIGRQPIQRDRPLHQPPNDKAGDENQHRGNRAEPDNAMMHAAPDPPGRRAPGVPTTRRFGPIRPVLTRFGRRASVASLAGIA